MYSEYVKSTLWEDEAVIWIIMYSEQLRTTYWEDQEIKVNLNQNVFTVCETYTLGGSGDKGKLGLECVLSS